MRCFGFNMKYKVGNPTEKQQSSTYHKNTKVDTSLELWRFHEQMNPTETSVTSKNMDPVKLIKFLLYLLVLIDDNGMGGIIWFETEFWRVSIITGLEGCNRIVFSGPIGEFFVCTWSFGTWHFACRNRCWTVHQTWCDSL